MDDLKISNPQDQTPSPKAKAAGVVSEDLRFENSPTLRALFKYRSKYSSDELTTLTTDAVLSML